MIASKKSRALAFAAPILFLAMAAGAAEARTVTIDEAVSLAMENNIQLTSRAIDLRIKERARDKAWNVPRTLFLTNRVPRLVTKKKSEVGWPLRYWPRRDLYIDSTLRVEPWRGTNRHLPNFVPRTVKTAFCKSTSLSRSERTSLRRRPETANRPNKPCPFAARKGKRRGSRVASEPPTYRRTGVSGLGCFVLLA